MHSNLFRNLTSFSLISFCVVFTFAGQMYAQTNNSLSSSPVSSGSDDILIDQYIQSKGFGTIVFSPSNIKQFWIDKTIVSKENNIIIFLNENSEGLKSLPLKIQLANVNEALTCKVDIITEDFNCSFSILNDNLKQISASSSDSNDSFLSYSIVSASFNLEDTVNSSFYLAFSSKQDSIRIKRIILSFTRNDNSAFLLSPGTFKITKDYFRFDSSEMIQDVSDSISFRGKLSNIFVNKKILIGNKPLSSSIRIKNTGDTPTRIYIGYAIYSKDSVRLDGRNYPFSLENNLSSIVSSEIGSPRIVIAPPTSWAKGCFISINAKEDMSDIPSFSLLDGKIDSARELDNGNFELILDKPVSISLPPNTKIRVNGRAGAYIYTNVKILQPGEEDFFTSEIKQDLNCFEYTSKALSKGVYYVVPLILSYSIDSQKENLITIRDYSISY